MKILHMVSCVLLWVGGLNWGLVGLGWVVGGGADWNLVKWICSYIGGMQIEGIVYILVGLATVWLVIEHKKTCRNCSAM